jgi:hypothetical protein
MLLIAIAAGILGNLLAYLSSLLTHLYQQITFDFSHMATFIIAIVFGPRYGVITGAIGALYPYVEYSILGIYGPFFGFAIIVGKAMTGFICGLLRNKFPLYVSVNISYIPESLYTFCFLLLMNMYLPDGSINWKIISGIITEGWVEVIIFSLIIDYIMNRKAIEAAVLVFEVFIIMLLVHKEFINTLLVLLLITIITLVLFEIIAPYIKRNKTDDRDRDG